MSKEDVTRFVADVKNNPELQNDLMQKVGVSAIVEVGNRHGYHITEEEVRKYAEEQKARLTEKELESVVGGLRPVPYPYPRIIIIIVII